MVGFGGTSPFTIETKTMTNRKLMTQAEVCDRLSVGRTTLWKLRRKGLLKAVYLGSVVRFSPEEVERFISQQTIGAEDV